MASTKFNIGYMIFLSFVAAIGGLLFGYDTAVISGTISQVTDLFQLDALQQGWYVGCALVGSIAGVMFAGMLSDRLGRKWVMIIAALLFSVSGIWCAVSSDFNHLIAARILGGIAIGVVSIVSPLYISEVAAANYRGRLVSLYQVAVTVGFLGAYIVNFYLLTFSQSGVELEGAWFHKIFVAEVWRGMLGMESVPAINFPDNHFLHSRKPPLAYRGTKRKSGSKSSGENLPDCRRSTQPDRTNQGCSGKRTRIKLVDVMAAWYTKSGYYRCMYSHARTIYGSQCRTLLRAVHLRRRRTVWRRFLILSDSDRCCQHADRYSSLADYR